MRSLAVLSLCALAHAAPRPQTPAPAKAPAPVRGTPGGSLAGNSLKPTEGLNAFLGKLDASYQSADDVKAGCTDIIAVIARGSMEPGNIGVTTGPALCKGLKAKYGKRFGCQGIGGAYKAGLVENVLPKGTDDGAIKEAISTFTNAATKCPKAVIVFSGYSQGAALMHNAVSGLPENIRKRLAGGVLFGDTKNKQSNGSIDNYDLDKTLILCAKDDGVCWGKLNVNAGHVSYLNNGAIPRAVDFLSEKIDKALGGK